MHEEVLVVDDEPQMLIAIDETLRRSGYSITTAGSGLEAVSTVERLHPDVLLLDLMMPDMSGFEVARAVRQSSPETKIVILTLHANEAYALEALEAGAMGYVIKHAGFEELLRAIRAVRDGRRYLCRPLSEEVLDAYRRRTRGDNLSP